MFDRIMAALCLLGVAVLAVYLVQDRYAAPACDNNTVASSLVSDIKSKVGVNGVYLLNARETSGGFFSPVRKCVVDAAPIADSATLAQSHWRKILYTVTLDRRTGDSTVAAALDGKAKPVFAANQ